MLIFDKHDWNKFQLQCQKPDRMFFKKNELRNEQKKMLEITRQATAVGGETESTFQSVILCQSKDKSWLFNCHILWEQNNENRAAVLEVH